MVVRLRATRSSAIDRHAVAPAQCRRAKVENQYKRVVPWEGNHAALQAPWPKCSNCARISNGAAWDSSRNRRCGSATNYAEWDAEYRFQVPGVRVTDPKAAQCGEVLKGVLKPAQCKLFGKECTPEHPIGALMVSSEGSCAAYYQLRASQEPTRAVSASEHEQRWPLSQRRPKIRFRTAGGNGARSRRKSQPPTDGRLFAPLLFEAGATEPLGDAAHLEYQRNAHRHHHR